MPLQKAGVDKKDILRIEFMACAARKPPWSPSAGAGKRLPCNAELYPCRMPSTCTDAISLKSITLLSSASF